MIFHMIKRTSTASKYYQKHQPAHLPPFFCDSFTRRRRQFTGNQCMLGHESIATTEIYTHIDRNVLRSEIIEHHPRNIKYRKEKESLFH